MRGGYLDNFEGNGVPAKTLSFATSSGGRRVGSSSYESLFLLHARYVLYFIFML